MSLSIAPPIEQVLAAIAANYLRGDPEAHQFLEAYRDSVYSWEGLHNLLSLQVLPANTPTGLSLELVHHFSSVLIVTKMELQWRKLTDESQKTNVLNMLHHHLHLYCSSFSSKTSNLRVAIAENLALALAVSSVASNELETLLVSVLNTKQISSLLLFAAICSERAGRTETQREQIRRILAIHMDELKVFLEAFFQPILLLNTDLQAPNSLKSGLYAVSQPEACPSVSIQAILAVPDAHMDMDLLVQQTLPLPVLLAAVKALISFTAHLSTLSELLLTESLDLLKAVAILMHTPCVAGAISGIFSDSLSLRSFPPAPKDNELVAALAVLLLESTVLAVRKLCYAEFSGLTPPETLIPHVRVLVNVLVHLATADSFSFTADTPLASSCANVMLVLLALPSRSFTLLTTDYFSALQSVPTQLRGEAFHERLFLDIMTLITTQILNPELSCRVFFGNPLRFCCFSGEMRAGGVFHPLHGSSGQTLTVQTIAAVDQVDGLSDRQLAALMHQLFEDAFCVRPENMLLLFLRVLGVPVCDVSQFDLLDSLPLYSSEALPLALQGDTSALCRVLVALKSQGIIANLITEDFNFEAVIEQRRDVLSGNHETEELQRDQIMPFLAVETLLKVLVHHIITCFHGLSKQKAPQILRHCLGDALGKFCSMFPVSMEQYVCPIVTLLLALASDCDPSSLLMPVLPVCSAVEAICGSCTVLFHRPSTTPGVNMDTFHKLFSAQHMMEIMQSPTINLQLYQTISIDSLTLHIPMQLPPSVAASIASCISTTLSRQPSQLALPPFQNQINATFSGIQQICAQPPSPQSALHLLGALGVLRKLVFRTNIPNIDSASGEAQTAFGLFIEDRHSLEQCSSFTLLCFTQLYPILIKHIKELFSIPQCTSDLSNHLKQVNAIVFPDDLDLPVVSEAILSNSDYPSMISFILGLQGEVQYKFGTCASDALSDPFNSLVTELGSQINHSVALPFMTSFLSSVTKLLDTCANLPSHVSTVTQFLMIYTNAVYEWAGSVAEHPAVYTCYNTCLHRLASTKQHTAGPAGMQVHPYGGVALQQCLPQIYTVLTKCVLVADVERGLARVTMDCISVLGASITRDTFIMLAIRAKIPQTELPRGMQSHILTPEQQQYDNSIAGILLSTDSAFSTSSLAAVQSCLKALVLALAGSPDIPQELFNRVASSVLSIMTMIPPTLTLSLMQQALVQLPCTHVDDHDKNILLSLFTSPARANVQGDMYPLERKYRMFVRDAAAFLRTPTAHIESLQDYLTL